MRALTGLLPLACVVLFGVAPNTASGQTTDLDARVRAFLADHQYDWRDLNVPAADGQYLYDLIIERGFTRALEVGTSTGHSGIWIAWALSKTGGKLITIEIDERRHREAVANFEAAGLSSFIDARAAPVLLLLSATRSAALALLTLGNVSAIGERGD